MGRAIGLRIILIGALNSISEAPAIPSSAPAVLVSIAPARGVPGQNSRFRRIIRNNSILPTVILTGLFSATYGRVPGSHVPKLLGCGTTPSVLFSRWTCSRELMRRPDTHHRAAGLRVAVAVARDEAPAHICRPEEALGGCPENQACRDDVRACYCRQEEAPPQSRGSRADHCSDEEAWVALRKATAAGKAAGPKKAAAAKPGPKRAARTN